MSALKDCLSKAVKGELLTEEESAFVSQKAAAQTGMTRKEAELWAAKDMLRDAIGELDSIARQVGKTQGATTRKSTVVLKTKDPDMAMAAMLEEHQIVAEKRIAAKREEEQGVTAPQLQAEAELEAAAPGEKGAAKQTRTYEVMREKVLGLIERNRQLIREREFKEGMTIGGAPMTAAEMKAQGITEESMLRLQHQKLLAALGELNAVMKFMPPEVRGKAGGFFELAKAKEPLGGILSERLQRVQSKLDKLMSADYRERIEKLVKGAQAQKKAGILKGTLGAEPDVVVKAVTEAMAMDAKEGATQMQAIDAKLAAGNLTPEEELALREQWAIINSFSDFKNRPVEHLADVYHQLRDFVSEARKTWRLKQEARIAGDKTKAQEIVDGFGLAPGELEAKLGRLSQHDLTSYFRSFVLGHGNLAQFLNAILPDSVSFKKDWTRRARQAEGRTLDQILAADRRLATIVKEALPGKGRFARAFAMDAMKKQKVAVTLEGHNVKMSQLEAIQYILSWEQPDVREKMEPYGWNEDVVNDLRQATSDSLSQAVGNFLREEYERTYQMANPLYREIFGVNMPRVEFYAPTRFMPTEAQLQVSPLGVPISQSGYTPDSFHSRVPHKNRLMRTDAMTVYWGHMGGLTHWVNHAELVREMRAVMGNRQVRESIKAQYGQHVDEEVSRWINSIAKQGMTRAEHAAINNALTGLISAKALSSLVLNLRSVTMQSDSLGRFLWTVPIHRAVAALTNPKFYATIPKSWHSDTIQRRIMAGGSPEARFMYDKAQVTPSMVLDLVRAGMFPMQYVDARLTSISAAIVYTDAYNQAIAGGLSETEAEAQAADQMDEAVWRYSQPTGITNRSLYATDGNALQKLYMLFMSDPTLKSTVLWESVRELATGKGDGRYMAFQRIAAVEVFALVSQFISNVYRDWFTDDDDDEIYTWQGYAVAMGAAPFAGYFLVNTVIQSTLSELLGEKWWAPSRDPFFDAWDHGRKAFRNFEDTIDFDHPEKMFKQWEHMARSITAGGILGPPYATAAAFPSLISNIIKPVIGLSQNRQKEED